MQPASFDSEGGYILTDEIRQVGVVGLGKLGSCVAACLASRDFDVIGLDADAAKVEAMRSFRAPVEEPRLQETIDQGRARLQATSSFAELVQRSEACFFVTPTPSLPDGSFDNLFMLQALRSVAEQVSRQGKRNYLFNVNSTVTPGTCDAVFLPMLEEILGGKCGRDFGLGYNPEFIALGNVVKGLLAPDFVLVGESDLQTGDRLEGLYRRFCTNGAPVERMSCANAELTKISVNCAVTMKISFVNQLSAVCAKMPGTDPRVILGAIGRDRRIGSEYLKPGLGYGGPCFPRDNRLFQYTAKMVGADAPLARATDEVNEQVNRRLLKTVLGYVSAGTPVGVLGLVYKPLATITDCSPGVWLCQQLVKQGKAVYAHDYAPLENVEKDLGKTVKIVRDPEEMISAGCSVLAITCPWPAYKEVFRSSKTLSAATIVDPWAMLNGWTPKQTTVSHVVVLH